MPERRPKDETLAVVASGIASAVLLLGVSLLPGMYTAPLRLGGTRLVPDDALQGWSLLTPAALLVWLLSIVHDGFELSRGRPARSTTGPGSPVFRVAASSLVLWFAVFRPLDGLSMGVRVQEAYAWLPSIVVSALCLQALTGLPSLRRRLLESIPPLVCTAGLLLEARALREEDWCYPRLTDWMSSPVPLLLAAGLGILAARRDGAWGCWFLSAWALALWTAAAILLPYQPL